MWVANLKIPYRDDALFSRVCKRNNVMVRGIPCSYKLYKDYILINSAILIHGSENDKIQFKKELKKDKRHVSSEFNKNFGMITVKQHKTSSLLLSEELIPLEPYKVSNSGDYIFRVGAWKKEIIINIIKKASKTNLKIKLISIKKEKTHNALIIVANKNLTEKQEFCLNLAIENGYYNSPRNITLSELAKIAKISYSTFQFHLSRAERKVLVGS